MNEKPLTPHEVAKRMRVSVETVRRRLREGTLTGVRFGRQWRIDPAQEGLALSKSTQLNAQDAT